MTHKAVFSVEPKTAWIGPPSWASQPTIEPPRWENVVVSGNTPAFETVKDTGALTVTTCTGA